MGRSASHRNSESGQALPLVVLFLLVMLGVVGLVLDGGMAVACRRKMQNSADAAVLAAGALLASGTASDAQIVSTATYYAQANGANSMTASYVDASGNVLGLAGAGSIPSGTAGLKVLASRQYVTTFAAVVGIRTMAISATATGGIRSGGGAATILALSSSGCPGLKSTGSGTITAVGGSIHANSTCSSGISQTGSGALRATGGQITVVGGYSRTGSGSASPVPITGAAPVPDPLASLTPPSIGSYPVRHGTAASPSVLSFTDSSSHTIEPGVYYGGIRSTGSGSLTLNPGVYIIAGGQLSLTGSGALIANGVFIYVTNDPSHPTGEGAYASVSLTGSGSMSVSGMTSGDYKNLAFFQDRNDTNQASITGSGSGLTGTFYFPSGFLKLTGSGSLSGTAQLIASTIELTGSGSMTFTHTPSKFYGVPTAVLIQ